MLENSNKVEQSNISAENAIGRDYINTTNNFYSMSNTYTGDLNLKKLLDAHELELQNNSEYQEFSVELNNFFKQKTEKKLRDLSQKLVDGNRENCIDFALDTKERVTKKIYKFGLYKTAQEVYTYLLANIKAAFKQSIESKIKSGDFKSYQIDDLVTEKIIEPFYKTAQGSSLCIDLDELYGLLYLLTGNCHIEWD